MKKTSTEYDRMKAAFDKKGKASFGRAQQYAPGPNQGGPVVDPQGAPTEDTVPTMLANGEYVLPADTVEQVGVDKLEALKNATHMQNGGKVGFGYADGGVIQAIRNRPRRIDVAEQAAVNNTPPPPAPPVKTIEQQTKEKVLQPAQNVMEAGMAVVDKAKKYFGMAEGGLITGRAKRINEAVDAAAAPGPAPAAAPAPPPRQMPANPLDAQIEAQQAAIRAKAAAEAAKPKGVFGRLKAAVGMADGGWVYQNGRIADDQSNRAFKRMESPRPAAPGVAAPGVAQPVGPQQEAPAVPQPAMQQAAKPIQFGSVTTPAMQAAWNSGPASRITGADLSSLTRGASFGVSPYTRPMMGMVHGGKTGIDGIPILDDVAEKSPGYRAPQGQLNPKLPGEPVAGPQQPIDEQLKRANAARPQGTPNPWPRNPDGTTRPDAVEGAKKAPAPDKLGAEVAEKRAKAIAEAAKKAGTAVAETGEKAKTLFGRAANVAKAAPGALVRGVAAPAAIGLTAFEAAKATEDTPTDQFAQRFGIGKEHVGQDGIVGAAKDFGIRTAGAASNVLNALTFGKLGEAGGWDKEQRFSTTGNAANAAPNAAAAPASAAAAPAPETINKPVLASMGITPEALDRPAVPDRMRGDIVRNARPDPGFQVNLGDYGGDGQAIFGSASKPGGRIDTFTGAGGGTNKATGYAPKGVDLGIKPGDVEKYRAQLEAYGELGPRPDAFRNPAAYATYQRAAAERAQGQAVGQAAMVRAQADFMNAITAGKKEEAVAASERAKALAAEAALNIEELDKLGQHYADMGLLGEDKVKAAATFKQLARTMPITLQDGRVVRLQDLKGAERAKHVGPVLAQAELIANGKPGIFAGPVSLTGQNELRPSTFGQDLRQAAGGDVSALWEKRYVTGNGQAIGNPQSQEALKYLQPQQEAQRKKDK